MPFLLPSVSAAGLLYQLYSGYLLTETARKTARAVPATAEDGAASVHSVWQDDVLQRTETGDASGRGAGLSRAAGTDEN